MIVRTNTSRNKDGKLIYLYKQHEEEMGSTTLGCIVDDLRLMDAYLQMIGHKEGYEQYREAFIRTGVAG